MMSSTAGGADPSVRASRSARRSASARGARSTTDRGARNGVRQRSAGPPAPVGDGSAERHVATSTTGTSTMLWARNTTRSSVETSAQWRSSDTNHQGVDRGALRQQRQHQLEHVQLRPLDPSTERVPERTQRIDERLERQFHPDEVDRPAEQHLETLGAGCGGGISAAKLASCRCRRHPSRARSLPGPCLRGRGARPHRRIHASLSHEDTALACVHDRSIAHMCGASRRIGHRSSAHEVVRPMRRCASVPMIGVVDEHEEDHDEHNRHGPAPPATRYTEATACACTYGSGGVPTGSRSC